MKFLLSKAGWKIKVRYGKTIIDNDNFGNLDSILRIEGVEVNPGRIHLSKDSHAVKNLG